ncbi:hypothetical protein PBT90_05880 [Algoriphagus halophytocola]|uniref:hypothetical protein n=1 Tax=Algoriphagus halophytocola TaxID=2991499 RepID=UPI0022DD065B|nr:hypothetical protein [Algoriphagus sp. TR-M9]WBL44215.1 hypothetical protein PBT90_05880 [Algoriphagus sp. TR-M9]
MPKISSSLILVFLLCLFSCVPSEKPDPLPDDDQLIEEDDDNEKALRTEFSYKVDGKEISGVVIEGENSITTLTGELKQNTDYTSISIGSVIFDSDKLYATVIIINTTKPFSSIKEGDSFEGNTSNPVLLTIATLGIADFDDDTVDYSGDLTTYKDQNLMINITEIDHENKLVSGTFSFDSHSTELDIHKKVTEGKFSNLRLEE